MKQIAGTFSNQFKLLLVDDIPLNLLLLEKMLQPYEFQITEAANGRRALKLIEKRQDTPDSFDLAIVDLMMPDIDGFQVIKYVREGCDNEEFHIKARGKDDFPLIILSAMNFDDDIAKGLAMGANQYLTKPVVMDQLYCAVTEELTRKVKSARL